MQKKKKKIQVSCHALLYMRFDYQPILQQLSLFYNYSYLNIHLLITNLPTREIGELSSVLWSSISSLLQRCIEEPLQKVLSLISLCNKLFENTDNSVFISCFIWWCLGMMSITDDPGSHWLEEIKDQPLRLKKKLEKIN